MLYRHIIHPCCWCCRYKWKRSIIFIKNVLATKRIRPTIGMKLFFFRRLDMCGKRFPLIWKWEWETHLKCKWDKVTTWPLLCCVPLPFLSIVIWSTLSALKGRRAKCENPYGTLSLLSIVFIMLMTFRRWISSRNMIASLFFSSFHFSVFLVHDFNAVMLSICSKCILPYYTCKHFALSAAVGSVFS